MYFEEISAIMYYFGDVKRPKKESVKRIYLILRDQMNLLLYKAEKNAYTRRSKEISHEDILFLMRRSKMKLKRLLKYLSIWDFKQRYNSPLNSGKDYSCNLLANGERVKKCLDFLALIEDCGEFTSFVQDEDINDLGALKRHMRRYWMTSQMDFEDYKEFANISQASFGPVKKFKSWLLEDKATKLNLTDCAVNIIEFLARETIAEMVDFILLMKMKKLGKLLPVSYQALSKSVSVGTELNLAITEAIENILNKYHDSEINKPCPHSSEDMCSTCEEDACIEESSDDIVHDDCNGKNKIEEDSKSLMVNSSTQGNKKLAQLFSEKQDDSKYSTVSHPECSIELHSDSNDYDNSLDGFQIPTGRLNIDEMCSGNDSNSSLEFKKSRKEVPDTVLRHCKGFGISNKLEKENMSLSKMDKSCDIQSNVIFNSSTMSDSEILKSCQSSQLSSLQVMSRRRSILSSDRSVTESLTICTLSQEVHVASMEDITDASDSEYFSDEFFKNCEENKSSKRSIHPKNCEENKSSKRSIHPKRIKREGFLDDSSDSATYLSIAARNEARHATPIEPEEIGEAYARLQEPTGYINLFATDCILRKEKLISLTESIYLK